MVSIVEVTTKAQLRQFVDYPNQLYRGVPQFVPATYGDDSSVYMPPIEVPMMRSGFSVSAIFCSISMASSGCTRGQQERAPKIGDSFS